MIVATHRIPGLMLVDHKFTVPLDHGNPTGDQIEIFAREVVSSDKKSQDLPWLVFLQGGPGFAAPRVQKNAGKWWARAVKEYRVLLLDQRGTGRSTPINHQTLAKFPTPQEQADYLKLFRADSIVYDAEFIRKQLAGKDKKWSVLGQSFGGFCAATYLSISPEGLREVIFTGGLPPLNRTADEVYRATYKRVLQRNELYYKRYPDDELLARKVVDFVNNNDVYLPNGERLSAKRFQQAGIIFGFSTGFEELHYLLELAFVAGGNGPELNYTFLRGFENLTNFDTNPIYVLLHEPCYAQRRACNWSADRIRKEFPQFDPEKDGRMMFTGEMVYPWMFDESPVLKPLKQAGELLARFEDWPELYDLDVLRSNSVPAVAVVYYDDMYVEREFSEEAAHNIAGIKLWVTNEYEHNGIRADGEKILDRLLKMLHDEL